MTPIVLDLPMPPSVNSIWRSRRGVNGKPSFYLDHKYKAWKLQCDGVFMVLHAGRQWPLPITVPVKVDVALNGAHARRTSDTDNRVKPTLDWLQRVGIIKNDNQVKDVHAHWAEIPKGCRVTVEVIG